MERWQALVAQLEALLITTGEMQRDREAAIAFLQQSLRVGEQRSALALLLILHPSFTLETVEPIVQASVRHRDALLAREVLGRLPYGDLRRLVPPAVDSLLKDADDDVTDASLNYSITSAYTKLCMAFADALSLSADPNVWEVGRDYMPQT